MGPIAIRRAILRHRHRASGLLAVLAVAGVLVLHHSNHTTPAMHHESMGSAAIEMCLGVFTAVGAAVVAVALGMLALGRWSTALAGPIRGLGIALRPPQARARAGPPDLHRLCVLRC